MGEYITYVWLGVILLALAVEFMSMDLSSIWFAVGGLVALIVSFIMPNLIWLQVLLFIGVTVALLFTVRPIVTKYFKTNKVATNSDKLVGKTCKVTKEIEVGERGYVKVDGKEWSAISNGKTDLIVGQVVRILAIDGNKLIVEEVE